ncbi:MAG: amidase [Alphaproteobacteria bacterium]|nr:amidase [Alphaproteobacteria bacterium]
MTEPCALSAVAARALIGRKALSPVELLDSCLARIQATNPRLNAFVAFAVERAKAEARAAEAAVMAGGPLPLLHGLPIGIKDLSATEGLRTTWGSRVFADHVPTADERVVAELRRAGAIVVGKTNTPEFGAGGNTTNLVYGPTRNPFDAALTCGGSSGGTAVALATDMVPIATGSDTGGSLRTPASMCGIVGFRPSPGLVPSDRRAVGWTPLSVQGPMGRSVADTALLLAAMVGEDAADPLAGTLPAGDFSQPPPVDLARLRLAWSEDLGFAPVDDGVRATFRARLRALAPAFRASAEAAPDLAEASRIFATLRAVNYVASYREHYEQTPDLLGPNVRGNIADGLKMTLADAAWAQAAQTRLYRRVQPFFAEFDVLVTPAASVPPFPVEQLYCTHINGKPLESYFHWMALAYGMTLTTHPAAVIPCGLGPTGLPFGLQVIGPRRADRFVLGVAHALEQLLAGAPETARPLPDLARLA